MEASKIKNIKKLIITLSIVIPVVVAILFKVKIEGYDFTFLPSVYATINALTAILLIVSLIAIKQKKIKTHELINKICILLSLVFLVLYIVYHITSDSTKYEGEYKLIYFFILITHIFLSIAIVPLVLYTYMYSWIGEFDKHKKLAKYTWPIWFYVASTGVVVYFMISPFYK